MMLGHFKVNPVLKFDAFISLSQALCICGKAKGTVDNFKAQSIYRG